MRIDRRTFLMSSGAAAGSMLFRAAVPAAETKTANLLAGTWTPEKLAPVLLPREKWKPFPLASDRAAWERLPADDRRALIQAGEARLGADWPPLPATLFLEYQRIGNRSNYERVRSARRDQLRDLVLAECVEGKGRFLDEIANGVWATCEESFWGVPAHLGAQKAGTGLPDVAEPIVDLFAAETSSLLAWIDYLIGPRLALASPLLRKRIRLEIDRRVLTPCLERSDFGWMGLDGRDRPVNNWNPWINSNWLASALLLKDDGKRRLAAVHKILRSLDRFLASYHDDGGCDEGPGYWFRAGGSLFDCLELLHSASGGAIDFYRVPLVQEIGCYIYRAHIFGECFINFADAAARLRIAGDLLFRYGRRIGDSRLESLGAWAAAQPGSAPGRSESMGRQLPALFNLETIRAAQGAQPLVRDTWLPGIQVMAARRKEGSAEGLYLAAQGGHNAESHNHNDVGNFIVYADGQPAIIDVGVETYTAKTFSSRRYEICTMQSAWHNLPTIDGVMQAAGREFQATDVAYRANDRAAEYSLDIARAYPPDAGLDSWKRTFRFDRDKNEIELADSCILKKPARRITQTLMTPCKPAQSAPGRLTLYSPGLRSGPVTILYDARVFTPSVEEVKIEDERLKSSWGERLYRILLTAANPPQHASWSITFSQR
ncbi:MAG: heparinase II/III family protein [Acidobacteria bacterium]|nr:heparinase II/III family protein [Acidobacteriota bacterium]